MVPKTLEALDRLASVFPLHSHRRLHNECTILSLSCLYKMTELMTFVGGLNFIFLTFGAKVHFQPKQDNSLQSGEVGASTEEGNAVSISGSVLA